MAGERNMGSVPLGSTGAMQEDLRAGLFCQALC